MRSCPKEGLGQYFLHSWDINLSNKNKQTDHKIFLVQIKLGPTGHDADFSSFKCMLLKFNYSPHLTLLYALFFSLLSSL